MTERRVTVEWIGGPNDGAEFKVREGIYSVTVMPVTWGPMDLEFKMQVVPIVRRGRRHYAVYPKQRGGKTNG